MQSAQFVKAVFEFVILIFSLCVHECAHAWMASRLGDQTARLQGRVTLNPIYHVDPVGTLLIPAMMIFGAAFGMGGYLIGWAKPTPVITRNFRKLVRDDTLTTLAGPVSNLLLALVGFLGLVFLIRSQGHINMSAYGTNIEGLGTIFELLLLVNLALFFFNLLPLPPLDGSRVLRHMLPYNWLSVYDRMGIFSLILMIFLGGPIVRFFLVPTLHLVYGMLGALQG